MRISDWSSDVCSSDLDQEPREAHHVGQGHVAHDDGAEVGAPRRAGGNQQAAVGSAPDGEPLPRGAALPHQPIGGRLEVGEDLRLAVARSEEHTSELQSLMRISYAVLCLKKKKK